MTHAEIMKYLTRLEQAIEEGDREKAIALVEEFNERMKTALDSKAD